MHNVVQNGVIMVATMTNPIVAKEIKPKIVIKEEKKSKRGVNAIEGVFREEGLLGDEFTTQLREFILFILKRYSPGGVFPDDLISFAYLRVMERLGLATPEIPKLSYDVTDRSSRKELNLWKEASSQCLFDPNRSNLGNYIFSIVRHAHSNYVYHDSKKFNELVPPATEVPEESISYNLDEGIVYSSLEILERTALHELPEGLRRMVLWTNGV